MRKTALFLPTLLAFLACTEPKAPAAAPKAEVKTSTKTAEKKLRVGLVLDIGGVDDKSFNESAYRGLKKAEKELGVEVQYYQPSQPADRKTGLRQYAGKGFDLVIGVGFIFSDEILEMAADFPSTKFGCVDMVDKPAGELPGNVVALKFKEEQGSFLAGALAAMITKTKKVGFIGGMNVPLIHKFEAGYRAGVAYVDPKTQVVVNYAGETPKAFQDPETGKNRAVEQYKSGVDIIYHASGKTGLGVFAAAKEQGKLAIGVDSDQAAEAPGAVLSSMVKDVDVAVYDTINAVKTGHFQSGVRIFGLAEGGVHLVYDANNQALVGEENHQKLAAIQAEIIAGKITVPQAR
ncbi:MAG: BMP family ABC transporter substrate-binding protein [Myxococcota bacterium]